MKVTEKMLLDVKAKQVSPPTKLGKRYITHSAQFCKTTTRLLVAVVFTPFGEHIKEITSESRLAEVVSGPMAANYYELTEKQVKQIQDTKLDADMAEIRDRICK